MPVRIATAYDAPTVAELLDAFNREFDTPAPGVAILTERLRELLAGQAMFAVLVEEPAVAVALVSLRPNAWYDGPAALLDELYVAPDRRGHGIGGELLEAAESEVRRRGGELLEINVDGQDVDARRFYVRHGYTDTDPGQSEPCLSTSRSSPARAPRTEPPTEV
ncbi:GNAT family N-acetyltransferase [Nocardioides sp. Iso805N]|uniref:GNAT family N-acetyltransferase n=1 Tax=Nocardioides sp. Iso805N TaxID=1283287 RepID=UPI0003A63F3A|nr:GNAT family N-acetyltransferase [Nocardioides sp. Iso805N]